MDKVDFFPPLFDLSEGEGVGMDISNSEAVKLGMGKIHSIYNEHHTRASSLVDARVSFQFSGVVFLRQDLKPWV